MGRDEGQRGTEDVTTVYAKALGQEGLGKANETDGEQTREKQ